MKFKITAIVCVALFLGACSPKTTPVQKKPTEPNAAKNPKEEKTTANKNAENPKSSVKEKAEMVISMILPFDLYGINYKTANLNDLKKAEIAIDFYQGFKMGIDSVANNHGNMDFKIQVFDSKDNPAELGALAANTTIKNSDLIIGPVFPNGIKAFSVYSKSMKKPMVSPLAASDPAIFNNPYLISVNNSLDQHAYTAAAFIKKSLNPKKVLIIRSGQADEYKYVVPFKKRMDSLAKGIQVSEIGIKAVGYANVYKSLSPVGLNVIVLPSTDRVFLITLLNELDKLTGNFQIAIVGHPSWEKASFLDNGLLERLNTYITSSYQIDRASLRSENFIKYYRSKFSLSPSEYAFKGFDVGYYFGSLMDKKGKEFLEHLTKNTFDGIHNDFHFLRNPKSGYYNTSLMVMKYQSGKLQKVY
ncbi:amino acid ABC transporter substrate-binding protein [Pedobacter sp. SD-b]|uniref:Amino acid ABC transporter substrate-binding protein n=1 Tax=Pedobacter segetis TaxID=2793069 RepID=A0ABS1BFS5_9SPHI|nr:ABC transporter substrate-binding protein [Pedobacter segetis]MBK0381707.1 amino acid ABC transporter substrate-binding protein [Pedobacter segetis]